VSYTQQLYQLQQIDSQLDAANRRLKEIADNLVESEALKLARAELKQAKEAHSRVKAIVTDLDLEVRGLQQKVTRHEKRLYSGKLVNPKEAASLQDEIESTKRWLAKREEDLLEAMIEVEDAEAVCQERERVLQETLVQWEAEQASLLEEQKDFQVKIDHLVRSRPPVTQFIDREDLARYETLRKQKGGLAVAVVEDMNCLSCGVMLSSNLIQQASTEGQLHFCDSCGRIIHVL
jgi:predicted  nucleic acid-binding Zn-ribbon protein